MPTYIAGEAGNEVVGKILAAGGEDAEMLDRIAAQLYINDRAGEDKDGAERAAEWALVAAATLVAKRREWIGYQKK